jgi:predicted transcriptional regulator
MEFSSVFLFCGNFADMKKTEDKNLKPLTRAESELMNLLWDQPQGVSINDLVALYPEPQPARTTVATFLKILEAKGYVEHRRLDGTGRTFVYSPLLTRERYVKFVLQDVRDTIFGSSVKKMLSFFVQHEEISDEELREILDMINGYD